MAKKTIKRNSPAKRSPARGIKPSSVKETPPVATSQNPVAAAGDEPEEIDGSFPIVGIGASAGGLEAFTEMLQSLPSDTGMGFVFVQHLDPKHVSLLTEILQRHTSMPVQEVTNGLAVVPDHLYVIPRNTQMTLVRGVLNLSPRLDFPSPNMPIDGFLRSLAADQKGKAIGVILSGNASDGALGMMAIKAAGGITFAQSAESAKHDGMPRSAIAAGCVDFALSPQDIGKELGHLGRHPYIAPVQGPNRRTPHATPTDALVRILTLLRTATGTDFTFYKRNTIERRVHRRMALRRINKVDRYIARLRSDPAEIRALHEDILINVTEFFRDSEVFESLKQIVFPKLLAKGKSDGPIRIWVPGCSSGEEVYSIAIALLEYLDERRQEVSVQIFGTDISGPALEKARSGIYSPSVVNEVSRERLRRFFTKADSSFQVSTRIREMCVFAKQNVASDPPFSKIHLISCRNLLIYLAPVLQKRVMPIFHFALKPQGFLLLGTSETIGAFSDLFTLMDKKSKIYARRPGTGRVSLDSRPQDAMRQEHGPEYHTGDWSEAELLRETDRIILAKYAPAGVVIDDDLNILQFRGRTSSYLEPSAGTASLNLMKMAREGLSIELRNAIHRAGRQNASVRRDGLRLGKGSTLVEFNFEVIPFKSTGHRARRYLLLFEAIQHASTRLSGKRRGKRLNISSSEKENARLKQELASAKDYLQSIIEEQESSNEELRSANEEIQSSNEEIQSTNEELETAKEELQATNEELNTINDELQTRNMQLAQAGNDLMNLLNNVNIPILMLGNDFRIRRFTPVSERLLNLIPSDVGRPITDINLNLNVSRLDRLLAEVLESLAPKTVEVKGWNDRTYSLRIRPYRTDENKIDGLVIVLVDMDANRNELDSGAERPAAQRPPEPEEGQGRSEEPGNPSAGLRSRRGRVSQHFSRELHDDVNQRLASLQLNLETLERTPPDVKDLSQHMRSFRDQIAALSDVLQRIPLQQAALGDLGLVAALDAYVRDFGQREHIQVKFRHSDVPSSVSADTAACLYSIAQECLRNVAEHSGAKSVEVSLIGTDQKLQLIVKDTGRGFDLKQTAGKGHLSLRSMRERVRSTGGTLHVQSDSKGTQVIAEVPRQSEDHTPGGLSYSSTTS